MKAIRWILIYMVLGGISFWAPGVVLHAMKAGEFSAREVWALTLLLPWSLLTVYGILWQFKGKQMGDPSIAIFMLLGCWIMGPLAMMIGATFSGRGFHEPDTWLFTIIATILFPIYTFMLSTYDGTLGGLLLVSALLITMHLKYERSHYWFIPKRFLHKLLPDLF